MYRYLIPVFAMLALGCEKVEESQVSTLQPEACEYVVMVAIDMSQSFCDSVHLPKKCGWNCADDHTFVARFQNDLFRVKP